MTHANKQRGEVLIEGPEGKQYKLCLTLGAIEQLETELGLDSLADIDQVFGSKPSMKSVNTILLALLHGGGNADLDRKSLMAWPLDLNGLMEKIREAFAAAGFGDDDDDPDEGKEPDSGN